jgi:ribosomal protein S18 acetylase RimI-like enzyme
MSDSEVGSGATPDAEVWRMTAIVGPAAPAPRWPDGISVRTWQEGDAPAVHALLVAAFAGSRERVAPYEEWRRCFAGDPSFEPATCFLAIAEGRLAGVALCWREGVVKDLAVAPSWRRRGIGEALLRHAFRVFFERGLSEIQLKVRADNPTGAVLLYERVGMRRA